MGNIPPPPPIPCAYKNQGGTIDDLKNQIYSNIDATKSKLDPIIQKIADYDTLIADTNSTNTTYSDTYNKYKSQNSDYQSQIDSLSKEIQVKMEQTESNYRNIDAINDKNETTMQNINNLKSDILVKSNSISYFKSLLTAAYIEIYNSISGQNHALINSQSSRNDVYSIDNSTYIYQQNRIQFFKNINTGLFYTYYLFIIILVYVIIKLNNSDSILVKLTLFRIFVVILLIYPLFIMRFQNFIYNIFHYFYTRLSNSNYASAVTPPGKSYKPPMPSSKTSS
jgi:predicted  nucleic acid-binding Zn-ribbon protein